MSEQNRVSPDSIRNLAAQTAESRRGRIAFLRVASRVFLGDAGLCVVLPVPCLLLPRSLGTRAVSCRGRASLCVFTCVVAGAFSPVLPRALLAIRAP